MAARMGCKFVDRYEAVTLLGISLATWHRWKAQYSEDKEISFPAGRRIGQFIKYRESDVIDFKKRMGL